ncbi:GNAT family N-acetyltransferase [Ruania suaedae]|uniref:GNAT family N-acetyltransferase n=1 Tax=Ruania suaedae TaxID=2897774 RepID=UPI001E39B93B|nr:GNAT family N-acetyltransferase [Ruania suaedae]UFU01621.1 GNAT family N-acetyltransferase [Ruania suaedae]
MSSGHLPVPGRHLGLRWRPLETADEDGVRMLLTRVLAVDRGCHPAPAELSPRLLADGGCDLETDSLAGFDPGGVLRAVATVRRTGAVAHLAAELEPSWRGRGIGRALLRWQDARARGLGAARTEIVVDEQLIGRRRLCAAAGYAPVARLHILEGTLAQLTRGTPAPAGGEPALTLHARATGILEWWEASTLRARAVPSAPGAARTPPGEGGDVLTVEPAPGGEADPATLGALLRLLPGAYASREMVIRTDVDADLRPTVEGLQVAGMSVVGHAVRYRCEPEAGA